MKKILIIIATMISISTLTEAKPHSDISFGFFYSSLSPYGEWLELQPNVYGWRPSHVNDDWRPYMYGRWAWTDDGWFWVSDEPFGWATFHYGRWYYDDYYGWIWMPGYDWAPAWVEWRYNDNYIGWSPLPPYAVFNINIGIHFTTHWAAPVHYWSFVHYRHFCDYRVTNYYEPIERTRRFFGNTRSKNDYTFENDRITNRGLGREFVERRSGEKIRTTEMVETHDRQTERIIREGERPKVEVYTPRDADISGSTRDRIEARKLDRRISLDLDKVDRNAYRERNGIQNTNRNIQENGNTEQRQREIIPDERKSNERNYENKKRSYKYKQFPEIRRETKDRNPALQSDDQLRDSQNRQKDTERKGIQPQIRERKIEIQREQVKPREFREQPRTSERPRNEGQRESRPRERSRNR
jgi:hypothetical protein